MNILEVIAENKIVKPWEGELDNLPAENRLSWITFPCSEERAAYTILKNAGVLPEELQLRKEIVSLQKLIDYCHQEDERNLLTKKHPENTQV